MVYLIDSFDCDLITNQKGRDFTHFLFWETTEERVKRMIENNRCRSIFSRSEIINLFGMGKIQMVRCEKIVLKRYDRIIVWTKEKRFYVFEAVGFEDTSSTKTIELASIFHK